MRLRRWPVALLLIGLAVTAVYVDARAQSKGNGSKQGPKQGAKPTHTPPGQAKKKEVVTTDRAIVVTREVLVSRGYEVVRIERLGDAQVVYYRRGNMGRGKGKGPVERMIVRPARERVVFEAAPRGVLLDINVRLGL